MAETLRLFLVEDDDDMALLLRKLLEQAGHVVARCRSAADALIVLGHTSFDLVLLDHLLPDMTGLELLQALTREGIATPALMVTAYGDEQLATRVLRAGALDYVVKDRGLTFVGELPRRVSEAVTRHRLEQMNALLVQALESGRDGVMITDLQGTILHVNQALEHMTGYSRQELLGQNPRLLKSTVHPPDFYAGMWRTIMARSSWQGELTNRRKDGSPIEVSLTIAPIVDAQGRLTHFVGIQRDISAHKQLERQLLQAQKMQSFGTLAGGIAHEFNNLLAGISGYAALGLRETILTTSLRDFLQRIASLTERAAVLTRQLLGFARKPGVVRERIDLTDLVRATGDLVTHTLHVQAETDRPEADQEAGLLCTEGDANQLQQALINLAINARDATQTRLAATPAAALGEPPPIRIHLRREVLDSSRPAFPNEVPPGDYVVVAVADRGTGMGPDVLQKSLDPFFTTKEVGKGTGLGLPMVFSIVQGHQGFLTIDSQLGEGTCVSLWLPRLLSDSAAASRLYEESEVLEPETMPGHTILVVDDEETVLDVVRRFLEIAGHQVLCALNGQDALLHLDGPAKIDLIILDLMIPREDARTTFQRLRQRRPETPIVLCTGLPHAEPAPTLLSEGAAGLIRKPFRMNEVWYAVKQVLQPGDGAI